MKKSLKYMTVVAVTITSMVITQPNVMAMSTLVDVIPIAWVSRTLQEVQDSIEQTQQPGIYTVQWGDTLSTISQATGISMTELSKLNNIEDVNLIITGSTLYIDYANHTITYAITTAEEPVTVSTETGEVVETPTEVWSQVAEITTSQEVAAPITVEQNTVVPNNQQDESVVSVTDVESPVENADPVSSEVAAVEVKVNESTVTQTIDESVAQPTEGINEGENVETTDPTVQGTPITVEATAYSYQEAGLSNFTADGTDLTQDSRVIAVDPSVIPLGTMVYISGYGTYRAADTGGAIVGNKIDIHFNTVEECYQFGRQQLTIYILN